MEAGEQTHFSHAVRHHLNLTFGEQWTGWESQINWPARSPDLNPLDIWLRGHTKSLVYSPPVSDLRYYSKKQRTRVGYSSEIRNFRQNAHLFWNAWKPHNESATEIKWILLIFQQALISRNTFYRNHLSHLSESYIPLNMEPRMRIPATWRPDIQGSILGCDTDLSQRHQVEKGSDACIASYSMSDWGSRATHFTYISVI
jgi:hypothetical protein